MGSVGTIGVSRTAVAVSPGAGAGRGVSVAPTSGAWVAVAVEVPVGSGVNVGSTGLGVTVGGPASGVKVAYRVGVANGVRVTVRVAVGSGVPGVTVAVGVRVGVLVRVAVTVGGKTTLVTDLPDASVTSVIIGATGKVAIAVAVGLLRGPFGDTVKSQAASRNMPKVTAISNMLVRRKWPSGFPGAGVGCGIIRKKYNTRNSPLATKRTIPRGHIAATFSPSAAWQANFRREVCSFQTSANSL